MATPFTIVVPLDGSDIAAAALPYGAALATATGAALRLLSVVEWRPAGYTVRSERTVARRQHHRREELSAYLATVTPPLEARGLVVNHTMLLGNPTEAILAVAAEERTTLVALATRGRGAVGRMDTPGVGSVADAVMRHSPTPVLLVRPPYVPLPRREVALRQLLVPLDGSALAEAALPLATEVAEVAGSELTLLRVAPWQTEGLARAGSVPEFTAREQAAATAAETYLEGVRRRLLPSVPAVTTVLRGRPANTLFDFALHEPIDLVVMTTHGRGGFRRRVLGSVAEHMVRAGVPTLLVRPDNAPSVTGAGSTFARRRSGIGG